MAIEQLALNNISISFGREPILRDVNLIVARGESVVLVGPSGQGKTVTLKLLAGLLAPDRGRVEFEGQDVNELDFAERAKIRLRMGMLFQKNALFDSLSVGENIAFPLREKTNASEAEIDKQVTRFLEAVGLSEARALYPVDISGGMQKRLGIARALALNPEIVFYDDPTAGLDPITSRKIIDLILDLRRERGSTIVTVTNDMARAYQLADRIVVVIDGELLVTGSKEETLACQDVRVADFVRGRSRAGA